MPKFIPQPGQIDFSRARWAPVINCVLYCQDQILIVHRSAELNFYPDTWNGISGFLDDQKSLAEKVEEELSEECGLSADHIISIQTGPVFDQEEPLYHKTWIVHPVLVRLDTQKIALDWEGQGYRWVRPREAFAYDLLPGFDQVIGSFFPPAKTVKFAPSLVEKILSGQKRSTWRLFDDKGLDLDDEIELVNKATLDKFGQARITEVKIKKLNGIDSSDYDGHEEYKDQEEMLEVMRSFYGERVDMDTPVKVIKFVLQ